MEYRIEQEGYEFNGVKLGSKHLYGNEEVIVIGFDEYDDCDFIAINYDDNYTPSIIKKSSFVTVILNGYSDSIYEWVSKSELKLIEESVDEENLPQSISPIHVADILEDVLQMKWYDEADEIREILNECIKSLRE